MQTSSPSVSLTSSTAVLWTTRLLSLALLGFGGVMLVGHFIGDAGAPSRPLNFDDYASLSLLLASLAGLGLAWKRERSGAFLMLAAVALGVAFNWRVIRFPGTLIPIAAMLFLWHSFRRPFTPSK